MAAAAPTAQIVTIEFNPENAEIARRILDHAGVDMSVSLWSWGRSVTAARPSMRCATRMAFGANSVDLVFIDHAKEAYLPDLQRILEQGWLRPSALVVADNVKFPGAPEYRAYMVENEGKRWHTVEHETHVEYQSLIKDLVLVSQYLGPS